MLSKLKLKSEFSRNVLTLMTGTTIAQAIPIAISPILTRIYTPEDFGLFALFMAVASILATISSARYELAILLPKEDEDAINIFALGLIINFLITIFCLIVVLIFNQELSNLLGNNEIGFWLYFIPITVFFIGIFNNLNYFNNRKKYYKDMANATIIKSIVTATIQLSIGFLKSGATGLISGQIISQLTANFKLAKNIFKDKDLVSQISYRKIISLSKEYKKFPLYSMPSALLNNLNGSLTNILISTFYGVTSLGYYSLVQRFLSLPTSIIGSSISQVFFQEATKEKQDTGKCINTFNQTLKKLLFIAIPIFIVLYLVVEDIFVLVFGQNWEIAGTYAKIILPLVIIRFITAPASILLTVFQKQHVELILNIILISTMLIVFFFSSSVEIFLKYFSFTMSINYLMFLIYFYFLSKGSKNV